MTNIRIALVASEGESRSALEAYLTKAGFEVHPSDHLGAPDAYSAVVLLGDSVESLASVIEQVMVCVTPPRVVVVTPKPRAFADLVSRHRWRLQVFPAPVFGWELVDALRLRGPSDDGGIA